MAVDIVPRKATGAALGVVGIASYIAAGIQDVASGWLIDSHITVATDGAKHYDFGPVALFWIAASVISFLLPLMNRKQKTKHEKTDIPAPLPADAGNGRRRKRSGKIHGCGKSHDRQQSPAGRPGVSAHRRSPLSRADPDSHAILPLLHGAGRGVPHRQPQHPRPVDHRQPTPRSQFDAHRPAPGSTSTFAATANGSSPESVCRANPERSTKPPSSNTWIRR